MENSVLNKDKWAKIKKNILTIVVSIIAVMTIISFAMFGKLARDYFVFDSNRENAKKELASYAKRIKDVEFDLQDKIAQIEKEKLKRKAELDTHDQQIAKREAVIRDQKNQFDESTKIEAMVKRNKDILNALLKDVQDNRLTLTVEQGKVTTAKDEILVLSKQRDSFKTEVNRLIDQIENLKQQEKIADKNTLNSRKENTAITNELQLTYSKIEDAKKNKDDIEKLYDKQKGLLDDLNAKLVVTREELKAKETAIGDANKRSVALKAEIENYNTELKTLTPKMALVEKELQTKESRKARIEGELSSLSLQLDALQNEITNLDKRKKNLLGEVVTIESKQQQQ